MGVQKLGLPDEGRDESIGCLNRRDKSGPSLNNGNCLACGPSLRKAELKNDRTPAGHLARSAQHSSSETGPILLTGVLQGEPRSYGRT